MENRMTQKQWKLLGQLSKERHAPSLFAEFEQFLATDLSKQGASKLIEQFLKAPKKSESPEYKAELAERAKQARERAELAEQAKQAETENCRECKQGHPVAHFNCSFPNRVGHTRHCTADLCF
jgi:hypothetical protein